MKFASNTTVTLTVSDPNYSAHTIQKTISVSRLDSVEGTTAPHAQIDIQGVI